MKRFFLSIIFCTTILPFGFCQMTIPPAFEITNDTISTVIPPSHWQYIEDRKGIWSIDSVRKAGVSAKFQFYNPEELNSKNDPMYHFWVRFRIKNKMDRTAQIALRFYESFQFNVYLIESNGKEYHLINGTSVPWSKRDGFNFKSPLGGGYFPVSILPSEEWEFFIRCNLKFGSGMQPASLQIPVLSKKDMDFNLKQEGDIFYLESIQNSVFFGVLLWVAIFNIFFYFVVKERVFLYFSLYVFVLGFGRFTFSFFHLFLRETPYIIDILHFSLVFIPFFSVYFFRNLLKTFHYYPKLDTSILILNIINLILFTINFFFIDEITSPKLTSMLWFVAWHILSPILNLSLLATLVLSIQRPENRNMIYTILPPFGAWAIFWSIGGFFDFLNFQYGISKPFFLVGVLNYWHTIENICLVWMGIYISWLLLERFNQLRKLVVEKELEKEIERSQLIIDQKVKLEIQVAERTHELQASLENLRSTQAQLIQSEKMATLAQQAEALRLKELDAVKTKLYTNITHEFRTPLTVILGVANQVLENPNEHLKKGLKMIMRNGQNLLTLVNQMLDLSKLESGKLSLHYHNANVISFLGYLLDSFSSLAESKGIQIHFISVADQFKMDFDEVRLQQIVSNILSNAIKFTPDGGHVYVSTDTKTDSFILKIKDTGIGIDEADLPHIFDRFYQADDSQTRQGEGTGIGLSLTYELVKLMQGTISVKSKKGQGAEFEVMLPIVNISDSKEIIKEDYGMAKKTISNLGYPVPNDEDPQPHSSTTINDGNGRAHVLIADDNEDVLAFVASCLESEFELEVAKNGKECEDVAFNSTPDLIVMDVMMPFKDGFEVCKTLKTDERTSHIPIVLLTAKADLESKLQGLEQGADDYLTKPFHKKELLLRVHNLLDLRRHLQQYYRSELEGGLSTNSLQGPNGVNRNSEHNGSTNSRANNHNPSIPLASSLENAFVIKVRKAIESHIEEPNFDVEKLCRLLALSHSQVHRKLIALTGLSATHFIRYVRLIKAKEMILKSGFSMTAIAYDCGFNDPAYFSRIFKQEFGISPQVWREQNIS